MENEDDRHLGMDQRIDRRDFIGGVAAGAVLLSSGGAAARTAMDSSLGTTTPIDSPDYPPLATGLRGQHQGSFEAAHQARDGAFTGAIEAVDTGERYDLVVVGGGISGLAAAHFFRKALGDAKRILVVDNHDDFGGHAKRNEFRHDGRTYISYGGTMAIETPFPYSYAAKALIAELGIDPASYSRYEKREIYAGLSRATFFDNEHFESDRLVVRGPQQSWEEFFAAAPLSSRVRADLIRIHTANIDYMPGVDLVEKAATLKRMSYQDFLLKHAKLLPESLPFFAAVGFRNNMRVDTCPAYTAARSGAVGFKGMQLPPDEPPFHGDFFHFPDGNASIARLLVARLVPGVFAPSQTAESIVTASARYDRLDVATNPTRIRLRSTVIRAEHIEGAAGSPSVRVVYVRDGKRYQVMGNNVVMACFNNIIRFLVPGLPEAQKHALAYASKVPMQYTNVLVRNWEPWKKLGVSSIVAPNGYHTHVSLDTPVSIGDYRAPSDPREPVVLHLVRNSNQPGLPRKDQHRAGRADMLATPFSKIEMEIRSQLNRMLGNGGFDAKRDILAITVNRWPHGYAYTYDTLSDPDMPDHERPHVIGRKPFGRIAIANADAGGAAFTNTAIDEAHRAVQDCLISRGLT